MSTMAKYYTGFCSLKICSARPIDHTPSIDRWIEQTELVYCSDLISEDLRNRQLNITANVNIRCASIDQNACNRILRGTCPTITEMPEPTDDSTIKCPPCPSVADCSTITHDPQPSYNVCNCPTMPSNAPTSTMPTSATESEVLSQINKVIDERDNLMVTVTSLGVLVGVLVVLLIVVTSGWVWTCWRMKRE